MAETPFRVTFLGTGTSTGVPVVGCTCAVCTSSDPRDQRLRCSAYVEVGGLHIMLDSGPDFRQQALTHRIRQVDAVLITHHHYDHVFGMEDLRPFFFYNSATLPCFASPLTSDVLRNMFAYIFSDGSYPGIPKLALHPVTENFVINGRYDAQTCFPNGDPIQTTNHDQRIEVQPIPVLHGKLPIYGYRIGDFAYLTDTSHIPESSFHALQGLDVLVLDALREQPHHSHFSIAQAVQAARRIGARRTYFIHMTHQVLHETIQAQLPSGMFLAHDGLCIEVEPLS